MMKRDLDPIPNHSAEAVAGKSCHLHENEVRSWDYMLFYSKTKKT